MRLYIGILWAILIIWWYNRFCAVKGEMRKLWSDHVWWTREYIIAAKRGYTKDAVAQRLLQNQDQIGAALGRRYGVEFGVTAAKLLREHILIAVKILDGDASSVADWYVNGEEIGAAMGGELGNVDWWKQMMKMHLDLTIKEAEQTGTDDAASIATFEEILVDSAAMADAIAVDIAWNPWKFLF